jgi:diguanylate cyclase (GGDEF)-like protein
MDVDRFKHVNDTWGHDTGDVILTAIGALLRNRGRETDYVIRWGGDEFLLLLTCTTAQAERKAGELKAAFHGDPDTANLPGRVGLSTGVAELHGEADELAGTIKLADERMYHDKSSGRPTEGA